MRLLIAVLFFSATPALAQVEIVKPWSRATPPGASVAAGYLTVRNKGASADRLVAVTSPAAARVETPSNSPSFECGLVDVYSKAPSTTGAAMQI